MATDVEESDTDDHERPVPPKRQRTRCIKVDENYWEMDKTSCNSKHTIQEAENVEHEDVERREKLRRWQACQVAKGFVDNTINKMLENFIVPSESYSLGDPEFRVFRGNDMENTAVMMAIRNHGLVQSTELVSQSDTFYSNGIPGYWTNNDYTNVSCCPSSHMQDAGDFSNSIAASSANSLKLHDSLEIPRYNGSTWDVGKIADSDQQEDFLERAVAEAIKKKGLSALSVDYG
ncbi:uncharacterized protein LOC122630766 [Vespula pensylvanica]|uniref:Uncharacterized protein n=1 Tax=Vespula pensylvanica TaxID=30213 RepID=A0A834P187_VESPE|nr:uncharacterized protein LOC122630766 [Vespula pensylvanica]XP_043671572.1 uncharacterized protein LOC122630766 [Vespula pensylvanica]XP_043671573.1 uncharacterized protein LOC122630766 [Vespula pensylvanica]KAF7423735.1 hypothetical protein H0235_009018 [Vespula pensylvanica]